MATTKSSEYSLAEFQLLSDLIRSHGVSTPSKAALVLDDKTISYSQLDTILDRVAASFQQYELKLGDVISICGYNSIEYACVFLGALRAGVVTAPIAPSVTSEQFNSMLSDSGAKFLFVDDAAEKLLTELQPGVECIYLKSDKSGSSLEDWMAPVGASPSFVEIGPDSPFNIIYSSGTTGTPKGILQSHGMRWAHTVRGAAYQFDSSSQTLSSTPLYSNTTLVLFFPTIAFGGTVTLMKKFDAKKYLEIATKQKITHTMLVPIQYQRIMAVNNFSSYDLSAFKMKLCTSAPFHPDLKKDVLKRWPGGLIEIYGMTEGGGSCILYAHNHPDKLHTVGKPAEGHEIRLLTNDEQQAAPGQAGEILGHSPSMMTGYYGQPEKTKEIVWTAPDKKRFFRSGDIGVFDEDGFLSIIDRKKDMIISGGFNIYSSDLEEILRQQKGVMEAAVVGVPSDKWGETPVAYVAVSSNFKGCEQDLLSRVNEKLGSVQRISDLRFVSELPRSSIGKVLKKDLIREHCN